MSGFFYVSGHRCRRHKRPKNSKIHASHFFYCSCNRFVIMKNNNLLSDPFRGAWAINPAFVGECEAWVNHYLSGKVMPEPESTKEIIAGALSNYGSNIEPENKRIAIIPMRGLLPAYSYWSLDAHDYLQIFRAYNESPHISAVVLHINGPGSSVDAINMMKEFAEEKKKPFVVLANACYSGHYWLSSIIADHIMAYGNISSGFGSIGVLSMGLDSRKAMETDGYKMQIVRAPQSTTKAQDMVDYYEGKDEAYIKSLENQMFPMAEAFINAVKESRPNLKLDTEGLFTGSVFTANQSLDAGLIDSIGNEKKAVEMAQMLVDLEIY